MHVWRTDFMHVCRTDFMHVWHTHLVCVANWLYACVASYWIVGQGRNPKCLVDRSFSHAVGFVDRNLTANPPLIDR